MLKAIVGMANPNKVSFYQVIKEHPLKRGVHIWRFTVRPEICSVSLRNAGYSVCKQLTKTQACYLCLSILRLLCQLCVAYRKSCYQIEAGVPSELYEVMFQQVIAFPFPFSSSTLEEGCAQGFGNTEPLSPSLWFIFWMSEVDWAQSCFQDRADSWNLRSEEARVGNGLIVAEELLPGPCCSPPAVSTSKMFSSHFPTAFVKPWGICQCLLCALPEPFCVGSLFQGDGTSLQEWELWSKNELLTFFSSVFCSAAVQGSDDSFGISSLCIYWRAYLRVYCYFELSLKQKSKTKKVSVAGMCIWDW